MKSSNKKFTVKQIVAYAVSILCLIFCIGITIEVISANTQNRPPRVLGISVSYVPTDSMEPTIMAGEYIMFKKASFEDAEVGDIVIYRSNNNNMYIVHRVLEKYDDYLITKGDNNTLPDNDKIYPDMIYGEYVMTVGILSVFSGGISKNAIFFILIFIFIIMIGMQVVSIIIKSKTDEINKNTEEEKKKLLEQLRMEILQEELEKLRQQNKDKEDAE